jgi:hypothetical protein
MVYAKNILSDLLCSDVFMKKYCLVLAVLVAFVPHVVLPGPVLARPVRSALGDSLDMKFEDFSFDDAVKYVEIAGAKRRVVADRKKTAQEEVAADMAESRRLQRASFKPRKREFSPRRSGAHEDYRCTPSPTPATSSVSASSEDDDLVVPHDFEAFSADADRCAQQLRKNACMTRAEKKDLSRNVRVSGLAIDVQLKKISVLAKMATSAAGYCDLNVARRGLLSLVIELHQHQLSLITTKAQWTDLQQKINLAQQKQHGLSIEFEEYQSMARKDLARERAREHARKQLEADIKAYSGLGV